MTLFHKLSTVVFFAIDYKGADLNFLISISVFVNALISFSAISSSLLILLFMLHLFGSILLIVATMSLSSLLVEEMYFFDGFRMRLLSVQLFPKKNS